MLVQLHKQNRKDTSVTELIQQGVVNSDADVQEWFESCRKTWQTLTDVDPEEWMPLICTETSESFVVSAKGRRRSKGQKVAKH